MAAEILSPLNIPAHFPRCQLPQRLCTVHFIQLNCSNWCCLWKCHREVHFGEISQDYVGVFVWEEYKSDKTRNQKCNAKTSYILHQPALHACFLLCNLIFQQELFHALNRHYWGRSCAIRRSHYLVTDKSSHWRVTNSIFCATGQQFVSIIEGLFFLEEKTFM